MSYEGLRQDFDRCVTIYKDFAKQSSADDRQLLGITTLSLNEASGNKSVSFDPEELYYDSNEWYALNKSDKDKLLQALSDRNGGKKASKLVGYYNPGVGRNNGQGKWKSKIVMLEKKFKNHKIQLSVLNTSAKPASDNEESDDSEKEDRNRKHSVLTRKGKYKRSKKA